MSLFELEPTLFIACTDMVYPFRQDVSLFEAWLILYIACTEMVYPFYPYFKQGVHFLWLVHVCTVSQGIEKQLYPPCKSQNSCTGKPGLIGNVVTMVRYGWEVSC